MANMAFQVARESTLVATSRYQKAVDLARRAYRQGVAQGEALAGSAVRSARAEAPALLGQAARHARTAVSALDRQLGRFESSLAAPTAVPAPPDRPSPFRTAAPARGRSKGASERPAPPDLAAQDQATAAP